MAADIEAVEAVSEILSRFAPGGTSVEPGFHLVDEGLAAAIDTSRPAIVRAYVPARDPAAVDEAIGGATTALGHLQAFDLRPIGELQTRFVHEDDWANAWKQHFPVLRVGRGIVIRPTWRRHRAAPGEVVLALDPGMAFGTGLHPTTRLCLRAIEEWADEGLFERGSGAGGGSEGGRGDHSRASRGARVLDVGCGSGILAIAAGKLGAGTVVAVDTDPIAIESTAANVRRNHLAGVVRVRQGTLPTGDPPFDLVLANLIASLLVSLAPDLRAELVLGGRLIASGIFVDRERDVREAFRAAGLEVARRWAEDDWVALEAMRAASG